MPCSCGKNSRQRLYCHRQDCGTIAAADLPPPTIEVTPATERDPSAPPGSVDVVVSRDGRGRSYRAVGSTPAEVTRDALGKVLGDHYSAEWIPRG